MKPLDPYKELDVLRDADERAIQAAFRRRSKETHPDAGGSDEAFARTKLASVVLLDPEKRSRYDATGEIAPDRPEGNLDAAAIGAIVQIAERVINQHLRGQIPDPVSLDFAALLREHLTANIAAARKERDKAKAALAVWERTAAKFFARKGEERLGRALKGQADVIRRTQIDQMEAQLAKFERALAILDDHGFEFVCATFAFGTATYAGTGTSAW